MWRVPAAWGLAAALATPGMLGGQERSAAVDAVFAEFGALGPGCAVGVARDGVTLHAKGYGSANLDHGLPLDAGSVFYLASVSKQLTAAAVVRAAELGLLSLDDDVRTHVPEVPDYGRPVTIRHLVHHTSGLRDYLTLLTLAGRRYEDVLTDEALLDLVGRQKALNFDPGTEYLYSNTGYVLLAEVVRRATGRSLREFADEEFFQPLGMGSTHFHDDASQVVARRVIGYSPGTGGAFRVNHLFNFDKVGDGGLYSTVEDLLRWLEALRTGHVGGPAFIETMHRPGVLVSGDTLSYAAGLMHGSHRGHRTVGHSGSLAGFRTMAVRYPDQGLAVVVLCNVSSANSTVLARRVAEVWLEELMEPEEEAGGGGTAPAAAGAGATGADQGPATAPGALGAYAGRYASEELDAVYRIEVGEGVLVAHRANGAVALRPDGAADRFAGGAGLVLGFQRDAGGAVDGFTLEAGRVRGIVFRRVGP